ncbi:MAG TPA: hypothetical protein DCQ04_05740 [Actinobacteria bacterium]|nr:hypothetical protein [Actinomycetota bacterium]
MATDPRTKRTLVSRRQDRFDQPLESRRQIRMTMDPETVGKFSERIARFLGSWRFIGYMTAFVATWVLWNTLAPEDLRFDQWPFIGLTLLLSLQASYAAPLILLAQNRQADRDRIQTQEDRQATERLLADAEFLARELASVRIALGEVATREFIRSELEDLSRELAVDLDPEADGDSNRTNPSGEKKRSKRNS